MYCSPRSSTSAGSSFSPDRMLRSTTPPVSRFFSLVRVKACAFAGLDELELDHDVRLAVHHHLEAFTDVAGVHDSYRGERAAASRQGRGGVACGTSASSETWPRVQARPAPRHRFPALVGSGPAGQRNSPGVAPRPAPGRPWGKP